MSQTPKESQLERKASELALKIAAYHMNHTRPDGTPVVPPEDVLVAALIELRLNSYIEAFGLAVECVQFGDAREAAAALAKYANLTIEEMFKAAPAEPISRPAPDLRLLAFAVSSFQEIVDLEDLIETSPGVGMHEDPAGHAQAMANTAREALVALEAEAEDREPLAEGRDHLTEGGVFRSDKYPWCRDGFVPLKLTDPDARKVLRIYADCHQERDSDFSRDLLEAMANIKREERAR